MINRTTIALIIVKPGPLQQSLQTLLTTLPEIEIVAEARDVLALYQTGPEFRPDLILLEAELVGENIEATLSQWQQKWPQIRLIVLVETAVQRETAVAAGADVVLFNGFRAAQLVNAIEGLLAAKLLQE